MSLPTALLAEAEPELFDALERRSAALVGGDRDRLAAVHHPELTWLTRHGERLDLEGYLDRVLDAGVRWHHQRLHDLQVHVVGDTAVASARAEDHVSLDGEYQILRLHLTLTWVREGNDWRCLAGHVGPTA